MATKITEECINCGACEPECPNSAITQGDDIYVIDPSLCTECVGFHGEEACAAGLPGGLLHPGSRRSGETEEELYARLAKIHPDKQFPALAELHRGAVALPQELGSAQPGRRPNAPRAPGRAGRRRLRLPAMPPREETDGDAHRRPARRPHAAEGGRHHRVHALRPARRADLRGLRGRGDPPRRHPPRAGRGARRRRLGAAHPRRGRRDRHRRPGRHRRGHRRRERLGRERAARAARRRRAHVQPGARLAAGDAADAALRRHHQVVGPRPLRRARAELPREGVPRGARRAARAGLPRAALGRPLERRRRGARRGAGRSTGPTRGRRATRARWRRRSRSSRARSGRCCSAARRSGGTTRRSALARLADAERASRST